MSALPEVGGTAETRSRFVHAGFVASARWYDRLTRAFSFGLDGRWRRACVQWSELGAGHAVLDVATGTGELVIQARRGVGDGGISVGLDFCGEMLAEARRKVGRDPISAVAWVQGRAEALPFRDQAFDRVMLGFALRHVDDLKGSLAEIARILRPDGRFVVVEWTRPAGAVARLVLLGYMRRVIPPLVRLVSGDRRVAELAAYLPESIERFVSGPALSRRIEEAGLDPVARREYLLGLVSLCVGVKAAPRALLSRDAGHGVRRSGRAPWLRSRRKRWVILASGVVLGIVAVQLLLELVDLLSR